MTDEAKLERSARAAQTMRDLYAGSHAITGHAYVGVTASGELHWGADWRDATPAQIKTAAAHMAMMAKHATQLAKRIEAEKA